MPAGPLQISRWKNDHATFKCALSPSCVLHQLPPCPCKAPPGGGSCAKTTCLYTCKQTNINNMFRVQNLANQSICSGICRSHTSQVIQVLMSHAEVSSPQFWPCIYSQAADDQVEGSCHHGYLYRKQLAIIPYCREQPVSVAWRQDCSELAWHKKEESNNHSVSLFFKSEDHFSSVSFRETVTFIRCFRPESRLFRSYKRIFRERKLPLVSPTPSND